MSIKSTHMVTRDFAIQAIISRLYSMSDSDLETVLEDAIHNGFYNFNIVSKDELESNKTNYYSMPYLDDLSNIPERNDAW